MKTQKRTVAIVCGGDSSEHDVSLRSAQGLYSFLDHERYDIYIVDVKGTDWHVNLDNGEIVEIDKNDFSFKLDGNIYTSIMLTSPSMVNQARMVLCRDISTLSICLIAQVVCSLRL